MNARLTTTSVMQRFHKLLGMFALSLFALQAMATDSPVVVSVDHHVKVSFSKVQFDAKKGIYITLVRINNQSQAALSSPLRLSFDQNALKIRKVRLLNAKKTGKDGQPYFEFALPKGRLVAGGTTKPVRVVYSVKKDRQSRVGKKIPVDVVQSLFASAYHVSAGVELALLRPSASPSDLLANSGKITVRFNVPLVGKFMPTTVYLRRSRDKQIISMNDLGKDGDVTARDGVYGVNVQIDTAKEKPDTCVQYETFVKQRNAELVSSPIRLCVSSFPVSLAESNVASPAVFPDGSKAVADEILLTVTPTTTAAAIRQLASSIHADVVGSYMTLNLYQLKLPSRLNANQLLEIISQLKASADVVSASINAIGSFAYATDDTAFNLPPSDINSQHGLKLVLAHDQATDANAWDSNTRGAGKTVVVMDTGLDLTHPDLGPTDPGDPAWTCQSGVCSDPDGHGTEVAGVIAAKTHNTQGVAGVAFKSKIHSIQVNTNSASVTAAQMITGFTAARDYLDTPHLEATVVNASFYAAGGAGTITDWNTVCGLVEQVVFNGAARAVVVNAVGNNNMNAVTYPAACKNSMAHPELLIAVSASISIDYSSTVPLTSDPLCLPLDPPATNSLDQRCRSSNFGAWVDIAAPGSMIRTTSIGSTYPSPTGNSFSAPFVAGAAAILNSCGMSPSQIKSTLISSANVTVSYPAYGPYLAGTTPRLDIHRALEQVSNAPTGITPSIFNLNENIDTTGGYDVGTLSAVDADTCDSYTYSINGGADAASFSINPPNTLRINAGVLDYETKSSYAVTVRVTDFFGATFDQAMTVNVNDLNEAPTAVTLTNQVPSTPENGGSIKVADIVVTDDALGTNALTPAGTDGSSFSIVGTELYFNGGANYEAKSSYNMAVEVDDISVGATPDAVQPFTLTISDANDPATGMPVIQPPAAAGNRTVGDTITADTSAGPPYTIEDEDGLGAFSYQWRHDVTDIPGANANTYVLAASDVGEFMSVCVDFTDGGGHPESLCSVTDAIAVGDPHITTVDGLHYDFQSAGEFVALRGANNMEIQLRMAAVSTAPPLPDSYTGLTSGVSVNTAVAARVGTHRVTYQPDTSPSAAAGAFVLRVDGVPTTLPADGMDLGDGGRVVPQASGIQIDFPDQTTLMVNTSSWPFYGAWWLHINVFHTSAFEGIMGARSKGSWLPRLSNGSALGGMPAALHGRYIELYKTFANSWRVTDKTSLFDYDEGTSTATFTDKEWPMENGPYVVDSDSGPVAKPLELKAAQLACRQVKGKQEKADCIFDVRVMGHKDLAKGHQLNQKIRTGATFIKVRDDRDMNKKIVTFTATVARHAAPARGVINDKTRAKNVPTGWVQFTLNGKKAGKPVKLNARGQAAWKVSRGRVEKQTVGAQYIPAKGSLFMPSRILGTARLPVEGKGRGEWVGVTK